MSERYRVVIAEDQTILREGVRALLCSAPNLEVVGEATDGQEAIRCVEKMKPHLILMDLSMPRMSGVDAIREIRKRCPETKILVLTMHRADEYIEEALKSGANGYVLKDSTHTELTLAIQKVLEGNYFISPAISGKFIDLYLQGKKPVKPTTPWDTLTHREKGILKLVAEGYRNKEVADFLCISVKTVEKHRANLMQKLDIHNVSDLTALAIEKGLITR
jgi:DNA-binding NarL/FixJ family response regulator